jgi:hypothetical protein
VTLPAAMTAVVKGDDEKRYTLGVAYPANRVDGHGEFMRPDEVERVAWDYVTKGRQIGLWHADGTEGHGTVVESYIYRGPDWGLTAVDGSTQVIKSGDWLLGVQWDEPAWALIRKGYVDGWSMQGRAVRRPAAAAAIA